VITRQKDIKAEDFIRITDEILYPFNKVSAQNNVLAVSPIVLSKEAPFMAALSTDDFPYTARYIRELLGVDDSAFQRLLQALQVKPVQDPYTNAAMFNQADLDLLKRAVELGRRGENLPAIVQQLKPSAANGVHSFATPSLMSSASSGQGLSTAKQNPESLAVLVDAITSSKESIMLEIGRLLDDRLSGLDEVVVELIRCKSENDALRQKLAQATSEKEFFQQELDKFKQVQFGFYKKVR
jgi:hypothetical protein